jgi:hypothetical protein
LVSPFFGFGDGVDSELLEPLDVPDVPSVFGTGAESGLDAAGELADFDSPASLFESLEPESGPDFRWAFFP